MADPDFCTPPAPFLEMWSFTVTFTAFSSPTATNLEPEQIRNLVVEHLQEGHGNQLGSTALQSIQRAIAEIVADRMSSPDFRYFVADFEERPGSWEFAFAVVGALYGGVCGYGSFRQGIEYVHSDLKTAFGGVKNLRSKVARRFKERHVLVRPRVEPTMGTDK